jgi:heme-degrading monooxygenase HmoA
MIVEIALITVQGGREADFEAAFPRAIAVLAASPGYRAHELHRSIETPSRYLLRIEWQTLEDHTVRFRASPRFAEWRAHIGPFLASPPVVEHFSAVAASP